MTGPAEVWTWGLSGKLQRAPVVLDFSGDFADENEGRGREMVALKFSSGLLGETRRFSP